MALPTFVAGPLTAAALNAALQDAVSTAQAGMAPASGSPNYAPASGSPNYAPASGSPNYAPASGSPNYAPAANYVINPMTAAGDLVIGGASGAPTRLAAGANGLFLSLVAGVPTWASIQRFSNLVSFSAGASGNWTVPAGISLVKATLLGGGGGGDASGTGCGGSAPYIVAMITVTPGNAMPYAVGAGGANAANGGSTSFAGFVSGGGTYSNTVGSGLGGTVTLGTGAAWSLPGQKSHLSIDATHGAGGDSPLGTGAGYYAPALGLGAGGAYGNGATAGTGGILILEY